jgi:hypothetical protein
MPARLSVMALLSASLVACSGGDASDTDNLPAEDDTTIANAESGTLSLPLTAETAGTKYRLYRPTFAITGLTLSRTIRPAADLAVDTETLPEGEYSIILKAGWVLQKMDETGVWVPLEATLLTPNPTTFTVTKSGTTNVVFGFATGSGEVGLGEGAANVRISVQDCAAFDQYSASLAALTVDCTGTIGPDAYSVNSDGIMKRNFDSCGLDKTKLAAIDSLLTIQFRSVRLPYVKECLNGRWQDWKAQFAQSGITACPTWRKTSTIGTPTDDVITKLLPQLEKLPQDDDGTRPAFLSQLKENYQYVVTMPAGIPGQKCQTPGDCATQCAGGLPGFVIRSDGETVLTDPAYWLLDTTYATSSTDPFLKLGYYHPMSYSGPLPGAQFAAAARAKPCPTCQPETCSYYGGSIHIKLPLRKDCLDDSDPTTCVAVCAPE